MTHFSLDDGMKHLVVSWYGTCPLFLWAPSSRREHFNSLQLLKCRWYSKLPLTGNVFIWRVLIGGLPLKLCLKRHGLATNNCFFCIVQVEDSTHHFIQCMVAFQIWSCISQNWQISSRCYLTPR